MHRSTPGVTEDDHTRTIKALHREIREQVQAASKELQQWLQRQYRQQAEETVRKMQRLALLPENADLEQMQKVLERDFSRLGNRIGSESMVGMQGSAEQAFNEASPLDTDLAMSVAGGREYLASLGFKLGQGVLHETWLLFRGSVHYDLLEHIVRDRMGLYKGSYGDHLEYVERASIDTYNLIYQLGESLTADIAHDNDTQEVTFAFSKDSMQYSPFRLEVSALMEHLAEQVDLIHASFWQRKPGLATGREFALRLRVAAGEARLREAINAIADAGPIGKETIVQHGKLLLGKRVL